MGTGGLQWGVGTGGGVWRVAGEGLRRSDSEDKKHKQGMLPALRLSPTGKNLHLNLRDWSLNNSSLYYPCTAM